MKSKTKYLLKITLRCLVSTGFHIDKIGRQRWKASTTCEGAFEIFVDDESMQIKLEIDKNYLEYLRKKLNLYLFDNQLKISDLSTFFTIECIDDLLNCSVFVAEYIDKDRISFAVKI